MNRKNRIAETTAMANTIGLRPVVGVPADGIGQQVTVTGREYYAVLGDTGLLFTYPKGSRRAVRAEKTSGMDALGVACLMSKRATGVVA